MFSGKPGRSRAHLPQQHVPGEDLLVEALRNFVLLVEAAIGSVVEAVRDLVDFVDGDAGLCEAEANGVDGKIAGVLLAAEALLLGGRHQFAVHHQRGGGVHALGNAVLALVQARAMRLLERHGVFQPADSNNFHSCPSREQTAITAPPAPAIKDRSNGSIREALSHRLASVR